MHAGDVVEGGALLPPAAVQGAAAAGAGLLRAVAGHAEQQLLGVAHQVGVSHSCSQGTPGAEDVATRQGHGLVQQVLPGNSAISSSHAIVPSFVAAVKSFLLPFTHDTRCYHVRLRRWKPLWSSMVLAMRQCTQDLT